MKGQIAKVHFELHPKAMGSHGRGLEQESDVIRFVFQNEIHHMGVGVESL